MLAESDNTVSHGSWELKKAVISKSHEYTLEKIYRTEEDQYAFDKEFEHSKVKGSAFVLLKPLDSNLAGGLQISRQRDPTNLIRFSTDAKEITIGFLDGKTTNKINVLHIDQRASVSFNRQIIYKNVSAHLFKMKEMAVLS